MLYLAEDAHWADPTTLELLALHIERLIGRDRILFVITYRPEFEAPWIGQPHTTLLTLNRLALVQSTALVAHASGDEHLPPEMIECIAERTDGVPLFIEELTKSVIESGILVDQGEQYALLGDLGELAVPALAVRREPVLVREVDDATARILLEFRSVVLLVSPCISVVYCSIVRGSGQKMDTRCEIWCWI